MNVDNSERNDDRPVHSTQYQYAYTHTARPPTPTPAPQTYTRPPPYVPAPAPAPQRPRRRLVSDARRSQLAELCGPCGCVIFFYIALQACQAIWIYYYVRTCVNPNPRIAINSNHSMWKAYVAFMYIFGALHSLVNLTVWGSIALQFIACGFANTIGRAFSTVLAFVVPVIAAGFIVLPMFGGIIVLGPVQRSTYNHRCDDFRLQVVLDAHGYRDPRFVPDVAHFALGRSAEPLFSFDLNQLDLHVWTFAFREFEAPEASIPPAFVPVLRSVSYNFVDFTVNGTCAASVPGGNATLCVTGTFDPGNYMSFDLISNTTGTPLHAPSRIADKQWAFSDDAPSLILREVGNDGKLGSTILRTAVTKKGDCTRLKVCVDGDSDSDASAVDASVLVPLGLILARQSDYAIHCTTPSD